MGGVVVNSKSPLSFNLLKVFGPRIACSADAAVPTVTISLSTPFKKANSVCSIVGPEFKTKLLEAPRIKLVLNVVVPLKNVLLPLSKVVVLPKVVALPMSNVASPKKVMLLVLLNSVLSPKTIKPVLKLLSPVIVCVPPTVTISLVTSFKKFKFSCDTLLDE